MTVEPIACNGSSKSHSLIHSVAMRLLTHNYLQSNVKGTTKGYPLRIEPSEVVVEESPVDTELVAKLLPKLNYSAVLSALQEIADKTNPQLPDVPSELPEGDLQPAVLEALHHVLFNVHVLEGDLVCPDTGRRFPIRQGIPNMILHEDEI